MQFSTIENTLETVQGKEGLKTKVTVFLRHSYHFVLYSMFVIQKRFKIVIDKILRITFTPENIC